MDPLTNKQITDISILYKKGTQRSGKNKKKISFVYLKKFANNGLHQFNEQKKKKNMLQR